MNSFNTENKEKLKIAIDLVEEIPATAKVGVANSVEIAVESGSAKFISSAKNMEEASKSFFQVVDEYVESGRQLEAHYRNIDDAL